MSRLAARPTASAPDALPPPPRDVGASAFRDAAALLWPAPATVEVVRRAAPAPAGQRILREHLLLPAARRPRLVVPARERRAGAAIARSKGKSGRGGRLGPVATGMAIRAGLADLVARDRLRVTLPTDSTRDDVETVLTTLLGRDVVVGLSVGAPRVNRKPVLHVLDRDGQTLAYVKVGHTPQARDLVRAEAATLRWLADRPMSLIDPPQVLHLSSWQSLELLVLSAVGSGRRNVDMKHPPYAAMRELAAIAGVTRAPLAGSGYLAGLRAATSTLADREAAGRHAAALDRIESAAGDAVVAFGAWHGDWAPWNMTTLVGGASGRRRSHGSRIALWDWERFGTGVPVGFDALHFHLQTVLHEHTATRAAEEGFLAAAHATAIDGGAEAGTGPVVAALYVAELAARYLTLLEGPQGAPLMRRALWIVPYLESFAARV